MIEENGIKDKYTKRMIDISDEVEKRKFLKRLEGLIKSSLEARRAYRTGGSDSGLSSILSVNSSIPVSSLSSLSSSTPMSASSVSISGTITSLSA
jgi:hypothetical protein